MESGTALLLSIRPRFVEQIFLGTKTVELRRIRPRVTANDLVVIYASGNQKALVGAFLVAEVHSKPPKNLWKRFGANTGLTKAEFDNYFKGADIGFAIEVARSWRLSEPVALSTLRSQSSGFHPPQSYRYLDFADVFSMGGNALLGKQKRGTTCTSLRMVAT